MTQSVPTTAFPETAILEKTDFERLMEKDFVPKTDTERFLLNRDMYWWQAERFHASGMYKKKFTTVDLVFAAMMYGLRFGWHPITSLDNLYPVNDRMTPSTQSMLGIAQNAKGGVKCTFHEENGFCSVQLIRGSNGQEMNTSWTWDDAQNAGLTGKDNWKKYPKAMLRWRCLADGLRVLFADHLSGIITTEEGQDFDFVPEPATRTSETAKAIEQTKKKSAPETGPGPVNTSGGAATKAAVVPVPDASVQASPGIPDQPGPLSPAGVVAAGTTPPARRGRPSAKQEPKPDAPTEAPPEPDQAQESAPKPLTQEEKVAAAKAYASGDKAALRTVLSAASVNQHHQAFLTAAKAAMKPPYEGLMADATDAQVGTLAYYFEYFRLSK